MKSFFYRPFSAIQIIKMFCGSLCVLQAFFPVLDLGMGLADMFAALKVATNRSLKCHKHKQTEILCELTESSLAGKKIREVRFRLLKVEEYKHFIPRCLLGDKWCLDELHEGVLLITDKFNLSLYNDFLHKQDYVHRQQVIYKLKDFIDKPETTELDLKEYGGFKASLFFMRAFFCLVWLILGAGLFSDGLIPAAFSRDNQAGSEDQRILDDYK